MQWLIIARDGSDSGAGERRLAHRQAHLEHASKRQAAGHFLIGGALLDEAGEMLGSAAVVQFETREALEAWLQSDPYVTGKVWQDIQVLPYRVAPHYDVPACPKDER